MRRRPWVLALSAAIGCAHAPARTVGAREPAVDAQAAEAVPPAVGERARRVLGEALLAARDDESIGWEEVVRRFEAAGREETSPGPATFDVAVALDRAGRLEDAEKVYLRVAAGATGELAWSAAERAVTLALARNDAAAARSALALAANALPGDVRTTAVRAELELSLGDPAAARVAAREVLARSPKDVRALCALARAHLISGSPGTARLLAARAAEADPEDARPLLVQVDVARVQNDLAAELSAARAAVEVDPDSAAAALALGRALIERGQRGEAVDHFSRAVEQEPNSFEAHLALGRALVASGQVREAERSLARAASLSPSAPEPHFELARVKLQGNADAQAALDEAKLFLKLSSPAPPPGHAVHALVHRCEEVLKVRAQASVVQGGK